MSTFTDILSWLLLLAPLGGFGLCLRILLHPTLTHPPEDNCWQCNFTERRRKSH
ncbi:hypothetical protein ACFC1B_07125 [Streptomyces xiamenensis]|uniref:hypothetical protein n=1 Tax=Streptomyces xiamenensis TaxID=408015 RepID=UPI0035D9C0FF